MSTNTWTRKQADELFQLPFNDLLFKAQQVHRANFDANKIQTSTLMSIKTGACPEDCAYCSQSARFNTGLEREPLLPLETVLEQAEAAKDRGATRFCMGAAWRQPRDKDLDKVIDMVKGVQELGMETCVTLGMLTDQQAERLGDAGLDYYNHNLDTSEEYYKEVITTRTYQDRLDTLQHVRDAGIKVCCGGIVGMGESPEDRMDLLVTLANLPQAPESVPINQLVRIKGTPLSDAEELDALDFVRMIAVARIMMPQSVVRLSAGRSEMDESTQALCFLAGANSIFYGEQLLTTENPDTDFDQQLLKKLGLQIMELPAEKSACQSQSKGGTSCAA